MTECLEAMFTSERFLAAVQATVLCQVMFVLESLVTDCTDERPLTCSQSTTWRFSQQRHLHALCNITN